MAIPILRFVDENGNDYPDWEKTRLGDVSQINPGGKELPDSFVYIDLESVKKGKLLFQNTIRKSEAPSRAQRVLEDEDILFQTVRSYQKNNLYFKTILNKNKTFVASTGYALLRVKPNYDSKFCYHSLYTQNFSQQVALNSFGSNYPSINSGILAKLTLSVPTLPEQQKIANLFSLIDEKIENLGEQVSHWKQYKQGLSQQLFSQQLRFVDEEGNIYPDWEEKKLGEMITKNIEKNKGEKYTYVESISNRLGFVSQQDYFDNHRIASKKTNNYTIIRNDCFAYNPSRINVGSIGLKTDEKVSIVSPLYVSFRCKTGLLPVFLLEWFATNIFKKQMLVRLQGSVRDTLDFGSLSDITLSLPSLQEQYKIANLLSSVDEKIENLETQESQWRLHKQALMQKMFV